MPAFHRAPCAFAARLTGGLPRMLHGSPRPGLLMSRHPAPAAHTQKRPPPWLSAFIALGSNMGDRVGWIEQALALMNQHPDIQVLRTSSLWETKPMYVEAQAPFLNAACEILTREPPQYLLRGLQNIERKLGRTKLVEKGPRNIDLDILLYQDYIFVEDNLIIPHVRMIEREFVLRPMCQLSPNLRILPTDGKSLREMKKPMHPMAAKWVRNARQELYGGSEKVYASASHSKCVDKILMPGVDLNKKIKVPTPHLSLYEFLCALPRSPDSGPPMSAWTPLTIKDSGLVAQSRTHIMAILNLTPDSFSDGGENPTADLSSPEAVEALSSTVKAHIASGATIIDTGGQSTRPNAPSVSAEDELSRILPGIQLIRSLPEAKDVAISVDTFRAEVAKQAIEAGADMINDVSAGALDPDLLPTVADLGCTISLMHMRGNPQTMSHMTDYPDGVVKGVAEELLERVREAEEAGIRRWRIILDPGIGFAKTPQQSVELLARFRELKDWPGLEGIPWLVGTSRKGFIGKYTGVRIPRNRVSGTAVTVSAAMERGAQILRVHDVQEMKQVVDMTDAMLAFDTTPAPTEGTVPGSGLRLRLDRLRGAKPRLAKDRLSYAEVDKKEAREYTRAKALNIQEKIQAERKKAKETASEARNLFLAQGKLGDNPQTSFALNKFRLAAKRQVGKT